MGGHGHRHWHQLPRVPGPTIPRVGCVTSGLSCPLGSPIVRGRILMLRDVSAWYKTQSGPYPESSGQQPHRQQARAQCKESRVCIPAPHPR